MMKKSYLFTMALMAVTALGITSCRDLYDDAVGFSTSMDNSIQVNAMIGNSAVTKANETPISGETTTDSLKTEGNGFNLFAWKGTDTNSPVIPATTFAWSPSSSKFVESGSVTTHYWPEGLVKFWAYAVDNKSVASGLPTLASGDNDTFTKDYTVDQTTQDDPVFAYTAQKKHDDDNYVNLKFQHMLSRVSINAYAPYFTNGYVRLLSFGFENVGRGGTFTYTPAHDVDTSTNVAFEQSNWSTTSTGKIGSIYNSTGQKGDTAYFYLEMSGVPVSGSEIQFTAGTGPVVPSASTGTAVRLSYTPTSGNAVTVPWLNVIPGNTVANKLVVTYQYYSPTSSSWITKNASVDIPAQSVPAKTDGGSKDIYNPGYQYIYNVRILGQEGDDASIEQAQIALDSVTVQAWSSQGIAEVKTEDAGTGKNLKTIIENAAEFSTVTLIKNVDLTDAGTINVTKSMTIDLAGYTITAPASGVIFNITAGKKVVIKGGTLDASAVVQAENTTPTSFKTKGGSGSNAAKTGVINVSNGTELSIEKSDDHTTTITVSNDTLSCIYVSGSTTKVTVNAGSFTNSAEGGKTIAAASDVTAGNIVVVGSTFVADYTALNNAATDETTTSVILSGDIDVVNQKIKIQKDFTIDLNGHDITFDSGTCMFQQKKGILTLTGTGNISSDSSEPVVQCYDYNYGNSFSTGVTVGENVTITSNAGCGITYFGPSTIVVKGKVIVHAANPALTSNGSTSFNGESTITINSGAEIISSDTVAIYHPERGTMTISGGTITGDESAIEMRAGTLNITGGTFTCTANTVSVKSNGDGSTTSGAVIAVAQHTTKWDLAVNISGGTFTGPMGIRVTDTENNATENVTLNVTGGTFTATTKEGALIDDGTATFGGTCNINSKEMAIVIGSRARGGVVVNINGGTYTTSDNAVVGGNGSSTITDTKIQGSGAARGANTFNISGGTFTSGITSSGYITCGFFAPWKDTVNITGGTFNATNGSGIVIHGGKVSVSGATIAVSGDESTTGKVGDSKTQIPQNKQIVVDYSDGNYPVSTIDTAGISGYTIHTIGSPSN